MKLEDIKIGAQLTYFPPEQSVGDNLHFPATVEAVGRRVRVRVFMAGGGAGRRPAPCIG